MGERDLMEDPERQRKSLNLVAEWAKSSNMVKIPPQLSDLTFMTCMEDRADPSPTQSLALPSHVEETKGSSITKLWYTRKGKLGHSPAYKLLCQVKTFEYYASFGLRHMTLRINQVQYPSAPKQVVPESSLEEDSDGCKSKRKMVCSSMARQASQMLEETNPLEGGTGQEEEMDFTVF
ncbi:hypothetical protein Cgig2_018964 [Carnegiea gigantea]|uniref:Uncharacterized protein n=1 Tax=Carnegiea gigantea TaxID=171969 RepID=A0A9Q1QBA2_9CARY|nr:hypothetical protein Cgig2_018964 [Carnegiea gigantea]